jgi:hypothetical protein
MNLNDFLERIPFLNRASSVLVCESDFNGLKAAVITRKGNELAVAFEAQSENPDFSAAVAEVVAHVRAQGWGGKNAALLSPAVMMALLELPIAAKNKLAPKQLADQIQYELEPLINQHLGSLTIGRLLVMQGLLTDEQVEDILSHQADLNNAQGSNYTSVQSVYKRFGEVADSLGYISLARIKSYLDRQTCFKTSGDDIQCGWSAQGLAVGDDVPRNMHHWLASAINKSLLRQWQAAFTAHGIKLGAIYPLVGSATSMVNAATKGNPHQLLIEVTQSSVVGVHLVGEQVHGLHVLPNSAQSTLNNIAEAFHVLEQDELAHIVLADSTSTNETAATQLSSSVEHVLNKPVQLLQSDVLKDARQVTLGMLGVARHVMRMKGAGLVTGVSVEEPQPPLMQHMGVRAVLGGFALLLAIGLAEGLLKVREYFIESENEKISVELKKIESVAATIQAKVDEVNKLKDKVKTLKEEKKTVQATVDLLAVNLPKRSETVITLLTELSKSVTDDVVVNKISEDPNKGFTLNAWAINEKSAQQFVKTFQMAVHPLGFKLRDITVAQATGRLGLIGYNVDFSATVLTEAEWKALKASSENQGAISPATPTINNVANAGAVATPPSASAVANAVQEVSGNIAQPVATSAENQPKTDSPPSADDLKTNPAENP